MGDFPTPEKLVPDIFSPYGTSIVLLHNEKSNDFFENIKQELVYKYISDDMKPAILKINSAIVNSHDKPKKYNAFWQAYESNGYYSSRKIAFTGFERLKTLIPQFVKKPIKFLLN